MVSCRVPFHNNWIPAAGSAEPDILTLGSPMTEAFIQAIAGPLVVIIEKNVFRNSKRTFLSSVLFPQCYVSIKLPKYRPRALGYTEVFDILLLAPSRIMPVSAYNQNYCFWSMTDYTCRCPKMNIHFMCVLFAMQRWLNKLKRLKTPCEGTFPSHVINYLVNEI